uniref:SANTA domain-containing protein n=1 Tax=Noccaea caerulescens TaxID=107243 RepID=A0A1J3K8S1_NOCCA
MAMKSKSQSLSARRSSPRTRAGAVSKPISSPRTRAGAVPIPISSPRTRSGSVPEPISSPRTCSRFVPEPDSPQGTDGIPQTPFSFGALTPVAGTLKSVSLSDWWLTKKANVKGLCVTGFESKRGSEVRLFSSGTISKRHDSNTLETFDGITICISGFINRSRSLQNGVSPEVCNRFLLGFPYNYDEEFVEEKKDLSFSFDDIPVNRFQDFLLSSSSSSCLKDKILDDVVDSLRDLVSSLSTEKECEKSRVSNDIDDNDESVVTRVEGVKTRGMIKRREDNETSIGQRVHKASKKKRSREKSKR